MIETKTEEIHKSSALFTEAPSTSMHTLLTVRHFLTSYRKINASEDLKP